MRDVSSKVRTLRKAIARAELRIGPETRGRIEARDVPKGDPLPVARVAAIQAAKETSRILPYCHPVRVDYVGVDFELGDRSIVVTVELKAIDRTGVEMEALTGASVAALSLYDMLKPIDDELSIGEVVLVRKTGGLSEARARHSGDLTAAVLVVSDSVAAGKKSDRSGQRIRERLEEAGLRVGPLQTVPDDPEAIRKNVQEQTDRDDPVDLLVATGGTGVGPRDRTPEAIGDLLDREVPGMTEAIRAHGQERTPLSMLSRSVAGVRGTTLIVALPGSVGAVEDAMDVLLPWALHTSHVLRGKGHD